eukprot:1161670-Pelagomonas_calceolata.AAC.8
MSVQKEGYRDGQYDRLVYKGQMLTASKARRQRARSGRQFGGMGHGRGAGRSGPVPASTVGPHRIPISTDTSAAGCCLGGQGCGACSWCVAWAEGWRGCLASLQTGWVQQPGDWEQQARQWHCTAMRLCLKMQGFLLRASLVVESMQTWQI